MQRVRRQDLNVLHQVCVFRPDRKQKKTKMTAPASDWLRHFRLLLWNRWIEFKETWQEARSRCPLPSLCISCWSDKQDDRPASDWLKHFSLLIWNCWMEFRETWQEVRFSTSSTKFVFFRSIWKPRWMLRPLIDWEIFDFSSETAEQN